MTHEKKNKKARYKQNTLNTVAPTTNVIAKTKVRIETDHEATYRDNTTKESSRMGNVRKRRTAE